MTIEFNDYTDKVIASLHTAEVRALTAIGLECVGVTIDYMKKRYGPGSLGAGIYQSGDLQRDVNSRVNPDRKEVSIGNSLNYSVWIHEGTRRMTARPYLRDAATENTNIWKEIAQEHIGKGMK